MKLEIRQAIASDCELCYGITEDAMRSYVEATWGVWEPGAQRAAHRESFSPSTHWIVMANGRAVGVVAAVLEPSHVQLLKLYLRSQARGRGIGARILCALLRSAEIRSQPLRLRVLAVNTRAQAFYRRHGFRELFRTVERVFMEARPNPSLERTSSGKLALPAAAAHVKR